MHCRNDVGREVGLDKPPPVFRHPELPPEKRLRGRRAHRDEHFRTHGLQLGIQPGFAGRELGCVRLLVDPALATRLPLEVLDRVGDEREPAVDSSGVQAFVENASRGAHEWLASKVFLVARLLSDEDDLGALRSFAEDRLRAGFPQVTRPASRGRFAKFRQIASFRDRSCCHSLAIPGEERCKRSSADHPLGSPASALAQLAVGRDEPIRAFDLGRAAGDPVVGTLPSRADSALRRPAVEDDLHLHALPGGPLLYEADKLVLRDVGPAGAQHVARVDENCLAQGVLRLYDHPASGNCFKARLLLAHLDEPYERVEIDIFGGEALEAEHRRRNPAGRVPVLELDDGTFVGESGAILLFLSEGSEYLPDERLERARVWQWLFFEQNQLEPSVATARVMRWRRLDTERPDAYDHRIKWANEALDSLNAHLAENDFLLGDRYTVADMALYAYTHVAQEVVEMSGRSAIAGWIGRVEAQPGFMNDLAPLP